MASIFDWSLVSADNSNADADLTWAEGQAPGTVNASARTMMKRVAELLADMGGTITATGSANTILVTANSAFTAYADGRMVSFKAAEDNTGAATLNVNSIGAKSLRRATLSGGDAPLVAGNIQAGCIYVAIYNTSLNSGAGGWALINETISLVDYVTLTGTETLTNKTLASPAFTGTPTGLDASTTAKGIVELATDAEAQTGTDTARAITPANLQAVTATETRKGVVELATTAEAVAGTDTARAVTPAGVAASLAADVYSGSSTSNVDFPIGTCVMVHGGSESARNAEVTIRLSTDSALYVRTGTGAILTGTWRARGGKSTDGGSGDTAVQMFQRVA